MPNVRVIYTSKMSAHVGEPEIQEILEVARRKNQQLNLTGLLCFGSRQFLQCLEGPRGAVNATYASIMGDSRHAEVVLLSYKEIDRREFSDWLMGYVPESSLTSQILGDDGFAPLKLNSRSALTFLKEVKQCIPVI